MYETPSRGRGVPKQQVQSQPNKFLNAINKKLGGSRGPQRQKREDPCGYHHRLTGSVVIAGLIIGTLLSLMFYFFLHSLQHVRKNSFISFK